MAISEPLSLPVVKDFRQFTFRPLDIVGLAVNQFNRRQQVQDHGGDGWYAEISLPPMERADAEAWNCFLLKCRGTKRTFLMGHPLGRVPRGSVAGAPVVDAAGQKGFELDLRGFLANAQGVLLEGDFLQIGNYLYKNLDNANADANGKATLNIYPSLRVSPSDAAPIITTNPVGLFRLVTNDSYAEGTDISLTYSIAFTAMDAL